MLVLLPMGILKLAAKVARVPEGSLMYWKEGRPAISSGDYHEMGIGACVTAVAGYLLMSVWTLGYAAVWSMALFLYLVLYLMGVGADPFADCLYWRGRATWERRLA